MHKKTFILFCAALLIPSLIYAQPEETGHIKGVVINPEGKPLPGVTVILESSAIVVPSLETITDENGLYSFASLPPGEYELIYSQPHREKVIQSGIQLSAGMTVTIDVNMTWRATEESIFVKAKAPTIHIKTTKGVMSLSIEFLQSLSFFLNLVSNMPHD